MADRTANFLRKHTTPLNTVTHAASAIVFVGLVGSLATLALAGTVRPAYATVVFAVAYLALMLVVADIPAESATTSAVVSVTATMALVPLAAAHSTWKVALAALGAYLFPTVSHWITGDPVIVEGSPKDLLMNVVELLPHSLASTFAVMTRAA